MDRLILRVSPSVASDTSEVLHVKLGSGTLTSIRDVTDLLAFGSSNIPLIFLFPIESVRIASMPKSSASKKAAKSPTLSIDIRSTLALRVSSHRLDLASVNQLTDGADREIIDDRAFFNWLPAMHEGLENCEAARADALAIFCGLYHWFTFLVGDWKVGQLD